MRQHQDAVEPQSSSDCIGDCPQHRNVALITPHLWSKPEVLTQHMRLQNRRAPTQESPADAPCTSIGFLYTHTEPYRLHTA